MMFGIQSTQRKSIYPSLTRLLNDSSYEFLIRREWMWRFCFYFIGCGNVARRRDVIFGFPFSQKWIWFVFVSDWMAISVFRSEISRFGNEIERRTINDKIRWNEFELATTEYLIWFVWAVGVSLLSPESKYLFDFDDSKTAIVHELTLPFCQFNYYHYLVVFVVMWECLVCESGLIDREQVCVDCVDGKCKSSHEIESCECADAERTTARQWKVFHVTANEQYTAILNSYSNSLVVSLRIAWRGMRTEKIFNWIGATQ